ncbi:MAG: hypothetical protein AAGJ93_03500 [Bacteroidota bacterium]
MRHFYLTLLCLILLSTNVLTQVSFQLGPNGSIITSPFNSKNIAFYHETTHIVIDQTGEWNFRLGEFEFGRTVNFNEKGQYELALTYFGEDAQVYMNTQFEYDEANRVKQVREQFIYAEQPMLVNYDWTPKTNVPTTATIEMNGVVTQKLSYDYRKRGRWEETVQRMKSGEKTVITREKNQIQAYRLYDDNGNLKERHELLYNEEGLEQKKTIYSPQDERIGTINFSYFYDDQGNWIKRLQHDQRTGTYSLTQRQIAYREELEVADNHHAIVGLWHSIQKPMKLLVDETGDFTLFELKEDVMTSGSWTENGWGQAELKMGKSNRIRFKNLFQQGWRFTAELEAGRLIMYRDGRHYEFVADWLAPESEALLAALEFARWEEGLWAKPGERDPRALPVSLKDEFMGVRPLAPNRFTACLADDGLCGIVDETAYPLIPFAYDLITQAFLGHYVVHLDGKRGLVDSLGQIIIPIEYESIWTERAFGKLVMGTRKNGKRYYYDFEKADFWLYEKESIMSFNDKRFVVRDEHWFLTDRDFEPIPSSNKYYSIKPLGYNRYLAMTNRRVYQIIDADGVVVTEITNFANLRKATFGYMTGQTADTRRYALLDHNGQQLTEPIYENLQFCATRKRDGDLCKELKDHDAVAKFRKPNGREGYLNGLGMEVE